MIFYIPVEDATDLQEAADTLTEHFSRFGDYWGVDPADVDLGSGVNQHGQTVCRLLVK